MQVLDVSVGTGVYVPFWGTDNDQLDFMNGQGL